MRIDVVTVFPDYVAPLRLSLIGKAIEQGLIQLGVHDLREHGVGVHRSVDDAPFGGGAGMLMTPEPWAQALDAVEAAGRAERGPDAKPRLLVLTPSGAPFTQAMAVELAREPWLVLACGRYEGIDDRVLDEAATRYRVSPVSIGDYVLAGGEAAALVVVEAVGRLLPGVLGNSSSTVEESHTEGLLEYPAYTRPAQWRGRAVPEVLRNGDHGRIARWRRDESLRRTAERRPDLLVGAAAARFGAADLLVLAECGLQVVDGCLREVSRTSATGSAI